MLKLIVRWDLNNFVDFNVGLGLCKAEGILLSFMEFMEYIDELNLDIVKTRKLLEDWRANFPLSALQGIVYNTLCGPKAKNDSGT